MATLRDQDSGTNDATGAVLTTAAAVATAVNDCMVMGFKREGAATTYTADFGAGNTASVGNAEVEHSNNDLGGISHYSLIASGTSITPGETLGASRLFRRLSAYSFQPASGKVFQLAQAVSAQGTSAAPNAGNLTVDGPGFAVLFVHLYGTRTPTVGAGWAIPSEFSSGAAQVSQYRLLTGAEGTIAASMTLSSSIEWVAQALWFREVDPGGAAGDLNTSMARIHAALGFNQYGLRR